MHRLAQSDPCRPGYVLYMVCMKCECVIVYAYNKRIGILRSMWTENETGTKACPTICYHCIDSSGNNTAGELFSKYALDITIDGFNSDLENTRYFQTMHDNGDVPTPALTQGRAVYALPLGVLPDSLSSMSEPSEVVVVCNAHAHIFDLID